MLLTIGMMFCGGIILFTTDFMISRRQITEGIMRNSYGKGEKEEKIQAVTEDGNRNAVDVRISERKYSKSELESMFQRSISYIETVIPGDNETMDHIDSDMELITSIPDVPVEIGWELSRYDVMNIYGDLISEQLKEEGTTVHLRATLTYTQDTKMQAQYECSAVLYPKTLSGKEKQVQEIQKAIQRQDENTQTSERLMLPETVGGKSVQYFPIMENRGAVLLVMAPLTGILLAALERQKKEQEKMKVKAQMERDYPEVVSKITLFLGAGMTVKRAWKKTVTDYEKTKYRWGKRAVYEEMGRTFREMESGVPETESYERFGRRCGLPQYRKLGGLLSQNLRKGNKDLGRILKIEAGQSLEERKARARRLGEETSTRLLVPMFLMLTVVLIIVIVPAFLSVQM